MSVSEQSVPGGAIAAAMAIVESLHGRQDLGVPEFEARIEEEVERWSQHTINRAFMLIIGAAGTLIRPSDDDPGLKFSLIGGMVSKFHRLQLLEVPDDVLPTVAGITAAAMLDQDPYRWRSSLGPIREQEGLVWCYVAWALTQLLDDVMGAGTFAGMMSDVLDSEPDEESCADQ